MSLRVYNTLSGKKEDFKPRDPAGKRVGMYVCGVTVYDDCHLGHARGSLSFDIIRRYLKHKGYEVTYVRNITDVDDKIIQRAIELHCPWDEIATKYTRKYYQDMEKLGIKPADIEPKATEHMQDMQQLVQQLVDKGYAYEVGGDVYFEVRKFAGYGKLSGRKLEEMLTGTRILVDEKKRDPLDFALWKAAKPGEPWWDSPWGKGRPGWHIECSAMSMRYLGDSFDIHGGGKDLIFPHHENEIAQSEAASDQPFVKYWLHNGFVQVDREKMSKSLGNFFTIKEILAKYPPEVVRCFLLSTHYRSPIDFSDKRLEEAKDKLEYFDTIFQPLLISSDRKHESNFVDSALEGKLQEYEKMFEQAMDDDFNTAEALGILFKLAGKTNTTRDRVKDEGLNLNFWQKHVNLLHKLLSVLGFDFSKGEIEFFEGDSYISYEDASYLSGRITLVYIEETQANKLRDLLLDLYKDDQDITSEISAKNHKSLRNDRDELKKLVDYYMKLVITKRRIAREQKDWATADQIRSKLADLGIQLKDHRQGSSWRLKT